jgi:hypothetical protein
MFNTFDKSQRFYDAIYRSKDYAGEARKIPKELWDVASISAHQPALEVVRRPCLPTRETLVGEF